MNEPHRLSPFIEPAAVQPWMDEPISYPLLLEGEPNPEQHDEAQRQTVAHGLGVPEWRSAPRRRPRLIRNAGKGMRKPGAGSTS